MVMSQQAQQRFLQAGSRRVDLSRPVCMGILNVTPDSFSDGGELGAGARGEAAAKGNKGFSVDVDKALRRAEQMVAEGAAIIDIGGESTRPGAAPVSGEEQMARVLPVVEAVVRELDVCVSVDTSHPQVMQEAINLGAGIINDVRALRTALSGQQAALGDQKQTQAIDVLADSDAAVCLMHLQGQPDTMQDNPRYSSGNTKADEASSVVAAVAAFLEARVAACREAGIGKERILLDPGFGFGKTVEHNYALLRHLGQLGKVGGEDYPLLVGLSRKSMIGAVTGRNEKARLAGSVAAAMLALQGGAAVIRSHDVGATYDAIQVYLACR